LAQTVSRAATLQVKGHDAVLAPYKFSRVPNWGFLTITHLGLNGSCVLKTGLAMEVAFLTCWQRLCALPAPA
jgi:hypothetical protein